MAETPAARGMRLAIEDREFAATIARNLYSAQTHKPLREAWAEWEAMTADERQPWLDRVVWEFRRDLVVEEPSDDQPPEPDGDGEPLPLPLRRIA